MPPEEKAIPTPDNQTPETPSSLKQIRTYQGDIATALQKQRESLVSIQRTEAAKRGGIAPSSEPRKSHSFLFFLGGFILIGLSALGGWFAYNEFLRKTAPPVLSVPENRLISSEKSAELDASTISKPALASTLAETSIGVTPTELKHLVLKNGNLETSPLVTSTEFLNILESRAPGNLTRAFDSLFMLGTLGEHRFIIFKLTSFENAFAGMLNWEQNLAEDLGPLFSTSEFVKNIGPESVFKDVVSRNKDVRVLYAPIEPDSATTTPAILYSFFDNKMLVITEDLETLQTLIDRLTRELLSR